MSYECGDCEAGRGQPHAPDCKNVALAPVVEVCPECKHHKSLDFVGVCKAIPSPVRWTEEAVPQPVECGHECVFPPAPQNQTYDPELGNNLYGDDPFGDAAAPAPQYPILDSDMDYVPAAPPHDWALLAARRVVDYIALPDEAEPDDSTGSPTEYIAKIITSALGGVAAPEGDFRAGVAACVREVKSLVNRQVLVTAKDIVTALQSLTDSAAAPAPAQPNVDLIADRHFIAGAEFGWNCGVAATGVPWADLPVQLGQVSQKRNEETEARRRAARDKFKQALEGRQKEIHNALAAPAQKQEVDSSERPPIDVSQQHDFVLLVGSDSCGLRGCTLGVLEHAWIPSWEQTVRTLGVAEGEVK